MRSQLGIAKESDYGVFTEPDRFLVFNSETLQRNKRTIVSEGIRASDDPTLRRADQRVVVGHDGTGTMVWDVRFDGLGTILEACFGAATTEQPAGADDTYEHTFTFGNLTGKSLTVQKGVEREDGQVVPFTFLGAKVGQWQLSIDTNDFARMTLTVDAREVTRSHPLATPTFAQVASYAHFQGASLRANGAPVAGVTSAQITGENPMKTERYYLGNAGLKEEQTEQGYRTVSGQLQADFLDEDDLLLAYDEDTSLELELRFVGAEIEDGFDEELTITVGDVRLDGETPQVSGPDLPTLTLPFTGLQSASGVSVQALLVNADATL
jgi:hypothetical protein